LIKNPQIDFCSIVGKLDDGFFNILMHCIYSIKPQWMAQAQLLAFL
jgi:hypothetical protein